MEVISDLHLGADTPDTLQAFEHYLRDGDFDALFILGDLFEVWVGDDVLSAPPAPNAPDRAVARQALTALRACTRRRPVYVMHGNRDFLLGDAFHQAAGTQALPDPCVLDWGSSATLFTHGDAWCLDDHDYQRFRAQVRSAAWQADFLARPLAEREAVARSLRAASEARKAQARDPNGQPNFEGYGDVDADTARRALAQAGADTLVHGHTHRPADHDLGGAQRRLVLSDWDAAAQPPRAEVLRGHPDGRWERRPWPVN